MFTATARSIDGSLKHEVDVNGRHQITTDEPAALGGTDTGPAPHELLPAMLASCVSVTMQMYASRHDWKIGDIEVTVSYDNTTSPRTARTEIRLPEGLSPEQIRRLETLAAACPVKRALETGFVFEQATVAAPAPAAGAVTVAP